MGGGEEKEGGGNRGRGKEPEREGERGRRREGVCQRREGGGRGKQKFGGL